MIRPLQAGSQASNIFLSIFLCPSGLSGFLESIRAVSFPVFIIGLGDGKAWSLISGVFEVIYCHIVLEIIIHFLSFSSIHRSGSSLLCMLVIEAGQFRYFVYSTDFANSRKEKCFFVFQPLYKHMPNILNS